MTHDKLLKYIREELDTAYGVMQYKNNEYSTEEDPLEARRKAAIDGLMSGKLRMNSWGGAVAQYVIDHPEEAETMARHHYQSFLRKKSDLMAWSISTGRHVNQIMLHRFIRGNARTIKAN